MKRFRIDESEKQRILGMHQSATKRQYLSEQSKGKLTFAFDNHTTAFEGVIGKDGFLYPYTEMRETWKVGPIAKVPFVGQTYVEIVKNGNKEEIYVTKSGNRGKLEMKPDYTVEEVKYESIPR
jgi:hypothetical protein